MIVIDGCYVIYCVLYNVVILLLIGFNFCDWKVCVILKFFWFCVNFVVLCVLKVG